MNIAIDTTPLTSGHSGRGVGVYTKYLIESLQKYERQHTYTFVTRGQKVSDNTDLVHYPYFDPYFLTLPLQKPHPVVVTVHDLIPLVFPQEFPSGVRGQIKWQIQKVSLRGSSRVIADSHSSKKDITKITGLHPAKIDVIYLAPAAIFRQILQKEILNRILKQYSLPEHFILYVGDVNWNKNIPGLLHAYAIYKKANPSLDIQLVLVGKAFRNDALHENQIIQKLIHDYGIERNVIIPGYVSESDLACIYNLAICLVQPSFYEGFGFPVLEAMACGCPVVCSIHLRFGNCRSGNHDSAQKYRINKTRNTEM